MRKMIAAICGAAVLALNAGAMAFTDTAGHWAENDINEMTSAGYLDGYPDGSFMPDNYVTRAEFLKIITLRYGLTQNEYSYTLWRDVSAEDWYSPYCAAGMIIPEYDDGNLYPSEALQRYEAAWALANIYDLDVSSDSGSSKNMGDYQEYSGDAELCALISSVIDNGMMNGKDAGFEPYSALTRAELCTLLNRLEDREAHVEVLNIVLNSMIIPGMAQ